MRKPWPLMFEAAKQGNLLFLKTIWQTYPDMMFEVDEDHCSIFHVAVTYRHYIIFSFINKKGPLQKDLIVQKTDKEGNNILHLAAKLPPEDSSITKSGGPADQMKVELLWFKEVKRILHPVDAEAPNKKGKTARALFTEEHKDLRDKAEKWTKEIANAGIVAATLIATVAFTAALTVPGGTEEDTGTPHFVQRASFIIFAISDAAALLFSSLSIVRFISAFSSQYEEADFDSDLSPVLNGLESLFLSVVFMMVGFCANMFIVFKDGMLWIPILITAMTAFASIIIYKIYKTASAECALLTSEIRATEIVTSCLFK
ncbi:ankyrin repeat-containing protein NPR4-like isoform X2 [Mangifera indica]|nr:ankyrin repeat-containing protein NPR4-like isoform X2 [Mangifera indica]